MADVTTATQCPNCMGTLAFTPESGKLECEFCGSSFTPEEIAAITAAKEGKASDAMAREEAREAATAATEAADATAGEATANAPQSDAAGPDASFAAPSGEPVIASAPEPKKKAAEYKRNAWDASTIDENWGEEADDLVTYSCSTCGGEIICENTTGATRCPYCGNQTIVPGKFSIGYKPNYIIPFKYTPDQAKSALSNHYRKKLFLPKEFTDKNQIDKLQGIYVPFWLYSGKCSADVVYDATRSSQHRDGDYLVTETSHYTVTRRGNVDFDKVPADASSKMPDDMMDSIEPFDFNELKPFSTAYLPGFLADKYDVTLEECSPRADNRCKTTTLDMLEHDVTGYNSVSVCNQDLRLARNRVDYALFPVYMIKTNYEGKTYLFAMNGQTGKLVGDLPASKSKFFGFMALLTVIIALILFILGFGGCVADGIWTIAFS